MLQVWWVLSLYKNSVIRINSIQTAVEIDMRQWSYLLSRLKMRRQPTRDAIKLIFILISFPLQNESEISRATPAWKILIIFRRWKLNSLLQYLFECVFFFMNGMKCKLEAEKTFFIVFMSPLRIFFFEENVGDG